jgi:hypothetical protein
MLPSEGLGYTGVSRYRQRTALQAHIDVGSLCLLALVETGAFCMEVIMTEAARPDAACVRLPS